MSRREKERAGRKHGDGGAHGARRWGVPLVALGAAGLLLATVLPLRGQGEPGGQATQATARVDNVSRSARMGRMRVDASFALPAGTRLGRGPRVRVTNARGELEELLPMLHLGHDKSGACYRDLHSENYPAGTYQIQCELETIDAKSARGTVVSQAKPLTIR